jgi:hypothetical protein
LWSDHDESRDESYDFCPVCGTDFYLQPPLLADTFFKCPVTGRIVNSVTKEILQRATPEPPKIVISEEEKYQYYEHEQRIREWEERQRYYNG